MPPQSRNRAGTATCARNYLRCWKAYNSASGLLRLRFGRVRLSFGATRKESIRRRHTALAQINAEIRGYWRRRGGIAAATDGAGAATADAACPFKFRTPLLSFELEPV